MLLLLCLKLIPVFACILLYKFLVLTGLFWRFDLLVLFRFYNLFLFTYRQLILLYFLWTLLYLHLFNQLLPLGALFILHIRFKLYSFLDNFCWFICDLLSLFLFYFLEVRSSLFDDLFTFSNAVSSHDLLPSLWFLLLTRQNRCFFTLSNN